MKNLLCRLFNHKWKLGEIANVASSWTCTRCGKYEPPVVWSHGENKYNYLIVLHNFWMESKGFEKIKSKAKTYKEAEAEGKAYCYDRTTDFNKCAYVIIKFSEGRAIDNDD
jgi:predicted AlkP superfamily phosphohydrolase/phosphomutase